MTKPAEIPPTEQEKEQKPDVTKTAEEIKLEQEAAAVKAAEETKTANERYVAKQDSEMTERNKIYKKKVARPSRSKLTAQSAKKHLTMQVGEEKGTPTKAELPKTGPQMYQVDLSSVKLKKANTGTTGDKPGEDDA